MRWRWPTAKELEAAHRDTEEAFTFIDSLFPELRPADGITMYNVVYSKDSGPDDNDTIRQKLIETVLGIYDPIGEEWKDARFIAAFKRRKAPHGTHCDGCHGLNMAETQ